MTPLTLTLIDSPLAPLVPQPIEDLFDDLARDFIPSQDEVGAPAPFESEAAELTSLILSNLSEGGGIQQPMEEETPGIE